MITLDKAENIIKRKFPDKKIVKAAYYGDDFYLFFAADKKIGLLNDMSDPYYLVNKNNGKLTKLIPTSDINGFCDAFRDHAIY